MATIELERPPRVSRQRVLLVEFRSLDGRTCGAVGGGPTDADAIEYACQCCPTGTEWHAVGWNDLYGE
jgi:hypothetical protein